MTDTVIIRDLLVEAVIGVYDWERNVRQRILVNMEMTWDNARVAASDDLADALDYAAVSQRIDELLRSSQYRLLETAAEAIADCVRREFSVTWLRLRLEKPDAVAAAGAVGIAIERGERPGD